MIRPTGSRLLLGAAIATLALAGPLAAQAPAPASSAAPMAGPAVGAVAPDFALRGVTRYGPIASPVRLADFRGQTVVLAFFYKARTKG